jgi:hypothetical protein
LSEQNMIPSLIITGAISLKEPELNDNSVTLYNEGCFSWAIPGKAISDRINKVFKSLSPIN